MADESLTDFVEIVMGQSPPGDKVSHDTGVPLLNSPLTKSALDASGLV